MHVGKVLAEIGFPEKCESICITRDTTVDAHCCALHCCKYKYKYLSTGTGTLRLHEVNFTRCGACSKQLAGKKGIIL